MAAQDIVKYQFKPGHSGNPNGRPKNRTVTKWLPDALGAKRAKELKEGLSSYELDSFDRFCMEATSSELQLVVKLETTPAYAKVQALSILFDMKNGSTKTIDKIRERLFGKTPQRLEVTGANGQPLHEQPKGMTPAEAREFIRQLEEKY